jgi:uncharacterized protein YjbI with pentapeptide repeats
LRGWRGPEIGSGQQVGAAELSPEEKRARIAAEAQSLDAIRKSVEDAASVSSGLWLSYLFLFFYIAIAVAAVTHVDLLLQNSVKLPFLSIELPLLEFFALIPFIFIILHSYTLVHFVTLAAKAGQFDQAMREQLPDADDVQEALRRQLPNNILLQFLAGPREIRDGGLGRVLKAIAWTTLVLAPILLLLLIQVQFLPYHHKSITWMHRVALAIDLIIVWALWPAVLAGRDQIRWPRLARAKAASFASLCALGFSWLVVTFPGERQYGLLQFLKVPLFYEKENGTKMAWASLRDLIFSGSVDLVNQRRTSIFSNTLVLPRFNIYEALKVDDPKKVAWHEHLIDLHGRNLKGAVLANANLSKADLSEARLQEALLIGAQLPGALLNEAKLQNARLDNAQLQGTVLHDAQLQGALLPNVQLQGASLDGAHLARAVLSAAQLQGASLFGVDLQEASLDSAQLQGAELGPINLGGDVVAGDSSGALTFRGGTPTNLQNASLKRANLEGASLVGANLEGASFALAFVWMADIGDATTKNISVIFPSLGPCNSADLGQACTRDEIEETIRQKVPEGDLQKQALNRVEAQLGDARRSKNETRIMKDWATLQMINSMAGKSP